MQQTKFAIINSDLTVLVTTRPNRLSGGWETPPFDTHWKARAWCNLQGYKVIDENLPTWAEILQA